MLLTRPLSMLVRQRRYDTSTVGWGGGRDFFTPVVLVVVVVVAVV